MKEIIKLPIILILLLLLFAHFQEKSCFAETVEVREEKSMGGVRMEARKGAQVVDEETGRALPKASLLDRKGNPVGATDEKGFIPYFSTDQYPLTVRYVGYEPVTITRPQSGTIPMKQTSFELPPVIVDPSRDYLHIIAYVREYSTLTTYTDTTFLFREKMVDFMFPQKGKPSFLGWTIPRILNSRSYYRFTDNHGLDSVSSEFQEHFSWSDWIGINNEFTLPDRLTCSTETTDTTAGRYSPKKIWYRKGYDASLYQNFMEDHAGKKEIPGIASFSRTGLEFNKFSIKYDFAGVDSCVITPDQLTHMSITIDTDGRERSLFKIFNKDTRFYVTTYAEMYIVDREFMRKKTARKWERIPKDEVPIIPSPEAPEIEPPIRELMARVEEVDSEERKLMTEADRLYAVEAPKHTWKVNAIRRLKNLLGVADIRYIEPESLKKRKRQNEH